MQQKKQSKAFLAYKAISDSRVWQGVIALVLCIGVGSVMSGAYGAASGGTDFAVIVSCALFVGLVIGTHSIGFGRHYVKDKWKRKKLSCFYYFLLCVEISVGVSTLVMFEDRKQKLHDNPQYGITVTQLNEAKIETKAAKEQYKDAEKQKQRGWQNLRTEFVNVKSKQIDLEAKLSKIEAKIPLSHNAVYERIEAITGYQSENVAFFARALIVVCSVLIISAIVSLLGYESSRTETNSETGGSKKQKQVKQKQTQKQERKQAQEAETATVVSFPEAEAKSKQGQLEAFVSKCQDGTINMKSLYRSTIEALPFVNSNAMVKKLLAEAVMAGKLIVDTSGNRNRYSLA